MIRIDTAWLATAPLDMRSGTGSALARVITIFDTAQPHHTYLFANKRANRLKILVGRAAIASRQVRMGF